MSGIETTLLVIGFVMAAFFAASESAFVYIRSTLKKLPPSVCFWTQKPHRMLSVTLVGTNISIVLASSVATAVSIRAMGHLGEMVSLVGVALFSLIFCEILPKSAAIAHPDRIAATASVPLKIFGFIFTPILIVVETLSRWATKAVRSFFPDETGFTIQQLIAITDGAESELPIEFNTVFLHLLGLEHITAFEAMLPLHRSPAIEASASLDEMASLLKRVSADYIVLTDKSGEPIRILTEDDILRRQKGDVVRADKPLYIPAGVSIRQAVELLTSNKCAAAFISDDNGRVLGTIGQQQVENTIRSAYAIIPDISGVPRRAWGAGKQKNDYQRRAEFSGDTEISTLERTLAISLPETKHIRTIAGFIIERFGDIPPVNTSITIEGIRFTIVEVDERTIKRVIVERI